MKVSLFPLHSFSTTSESVLSSLKSKSYHDSPTLLKIALSHPNLVKHQDFKTYLKMAIVKSPTPNYSKPDLIIIRLLLTYSKFSNPDFQWKGVILKSLENFKEKDLNIWDLGLIMSIYYDALRRFYEIKGRENDFFSDKRILFAKEKEYNTALQLSFVNLKEYFLVLRGKKTAGKLFYEYVLDRFFELIEKKKPFSEKNTDILFFFKIFIGFEFKNEKLEKMIAEILKSGVSLNDLTEIYLTYFRKLGFAFPEVFQAFIEKIDEKIQTNEKIEINRVSEPHFLYLPIDNMRNILGKSIEVSESLMRSSNLLSNRNLIDVYWMLSRNYNPKLADFLKDLEGKLESLIGSFLFKDLVFLLISKIYHNLSKKGQEIKIESYLELLMKISEKIEKKDENIWEILNVKTISGNLFLSLKLLSFYGHSELIEDKFDEDLMLFLGKQWLSATRNRKTSNSEKIIRLVNRLI